MSPFEHGEVFVLDDGGEVSAFAGTRPGGPLEAKYAGQPTAVSCLQVDLDLGNYERFLDITLTKDNNITTGKIYQASQFAGGPKSSRYAMGSGGNLSLQPPMLLLACAADASGLSLGLQNLQSVLPCAVCD